MLELKRLFLLGLVILFVSCSAQKSNQISVLFYNVENLFDCVDDSLKQDDEFTPQGSKEWTEAKLWSKVNTLVKVIRGMDSELPDFIGLCEVENATVLQLMVDHPLLRSKKYEILHFESPDVRGIDVAFLYASEEFNPYFFMPINVALEPRPTRDILVVEGTVASGDSIRFFVNHWPSRYGGKKKSSPKRIEVANKLLQFSDSLEAIRNVSLQIAMGDFNDEQKDSSLQVLINSNWEYKEPQNYTSEIKGTYKYRSSWGQYDAFLLDTDLAYFSDMQVAVNGWLFVPDEQYGGLKINRSFLGDFYNGGPSDHLPISLEIHW
jgi:hypothetical protein